MGLHYMTHPMIVCLVLWLDVLHTPSTLHSSFHATTNHVYVSIVIIEQFKASTVLLDIHVQHTFTLCSFCEPADAIIEKTSIFMSKYVMKISPPVPRRKGWEDTDEETGIFYIKFKTSAGRDEVRVTQQLKLNCGQLHVSSTCSTKHCSCMTYCMCDNWSVHRQVTIKGHTSSSKAQ